MAENERTTGEEKQGGERVTLAAFIKDNHALMEVLGIFAALAVFAGNLPVKPIGYGLSFMFLTMVVLIWLELWGSFPSDGTTLLGLFENILMLVILGFVVYWLLDYRGIWHHFLVVPVSAIILGLFSFVMKRFDVFNRLFRAEPGQRKALRYILGIVAIVVVVFVSFRLGDMIAQPLNAALDTLYRELRQNTHSATREPIATSEPTETPLPPKITTPTPAAVSASGSATTRPSLIREWGPFVVGLGGLIVGGATIYLSYRERVASHRETLHSKQLELWQEVMTIIGEFFSCVQSGRTPDPEQVRALMTVATRAELILPDEAVDPLYDVLYALAGLEGGITPERVERLDKTVFQLFKTARSSLGVGPLSQETLRLFRRLPGDHPPA